MSHLEKTMYISRHGESSTNPQRRFSGRLNPSLTEQGRVQSQNLGKELKDGNITSIYTSNARRAQETSEIVSGIIGARIVEKPELREREIGDWEGKSPEELREMLGHNWYMQIPKNGESDLGFHTRMHKGLLGVLVDSQKHGDENFLVVTHGGPMVRFHAMLGYNPFPDDGGFSVPNAIPYSFSVAYVKGKLFPTV